jgi:hypothetical protein
VGQHLHIVVVTSKFLMLPSAIMMTPKVRDGLVATIEERQSNDE